MSLKFPVSLVGKRALSGGDVPFATSLYDSGENLLVSIETDIPANWNDNNTPYNATRLEIGTSCTSIGLEAFQNCTNLTGDLVIPNSVTSIASYAFSYCYSLTSLTIGNSVTTIESYAFSYCGFTGPLVIPSSVTNISSYSFFYNSLLTTAYLAPPLASVGSYAFQNCSSLTTVYAKDAVANGWTLGADQIVGGKYGVTVIDWTNYPNVP